MWRSGGCGVVSRFVLVLTDDHDVGSSARDSSVTE